MLVRNIYENRVKHPTKDVLMTSHRDWSSNASLRIEGGGGGPGAASFA